MNFKQGMPVISSLRNTALKERHWNQIQEIIGTEVVQDKSFTLGNLLQLQASTRLLSIVPVQTVLFVLFFTDYERTSMTREEQAR